MRTATKYAPLWVAAGAVALAIAAAPQGSADPINCIALNTGSTKCQTPGNAEIDNNLSRANTLPQWSSFGGQSGGPYGGQYGGGTR